MPTQRSSVSRSPSSEASYSGRPFVSRTREPKRDGAERVRRRHWRLDPVRARRRRRERTADDRELALGPYLVWAVVGADEYAKAVVFGLVLDDARQLEVVEIRGPNRRLDPYPRELVLEYLCVAVPPTADQLRRRGRGRRGKTCRDRRRPARPRREAGRRSARGRSASRQLRAVPVVGRRSRRARTARPRRRGAGGTATCSRARRRPRRPPARRSRASGRAARSGRACPGAPRRTSSRRSSRAAGCGAGRATRAAGLRPGQARPRAACAAPRPSRSRAAAARRARSPA